MKIDSTRDVVHATESAISHQTSEDGRSTDAPFAVLDWCYYCWRVMRWVTSLSSLMFYTCSCSCNPSKVVPSTWHCQCQCQCQRKFI